MELAIRPGSCVSLGRKVLDVNVHNEAAGLTLRFFSLAKLHHDSQGRLRTFTPTMAQEWWQPFLHRFSKIVIHARVTPNHIEDRGYYVDDPHITVIPMPYYEGVLGYIRKLAPIRKFIASRITEPGDHYGLWVPSQIASIVTRQVSKMNAPLLAIVIGDGAAVATSIAPAPFKRILAKYVARQDRKSVSRASGVIYVTLNALQLKYPARPGALTLARSNVQLSEDLLSERPRDIDAAAARDGLSLIAVGSQEQNYKGHDILIEAVAALQREGYRLRLTIVGEGKLHETLRAQAANLGVRDVTFIKRVGDSGDVAKEIARHDIFVMPSRTEGMPKTLLEAMAVGTFALGSDVGGIPEVLDSECVFEVNSVDAIVKTLGIFLENPGRISSQARAQYDTIRHFLVNHAGTPVLMRFLDDWVETSQLGIPTDDSPNVFGQQPSLIINDDPGPRHSSDHKTKVD